VKSVPQGASLDHYVPAASVNYRDEFTTVSQAEKFADLAVAVTSAGDASVRSSAATAPRRTASASQTSIHVGALQDALTLYLHGMSMLKEGIDKAVTMQSQVRVLSALGCDTCLRNVTASRVSFFALHACYAAHPRAEAALRWNFG
jgi:hypothetical protein